MSDTTFTTDEWAGFDRGRQLRQAAIAVLQNYDTPAGPRVFDTPLDPYQLDLLPLIGVSERQTRETIGAAGGRPQFRVRNTLLVQCVGIAALEPDVIAQMDAFRATVLDALLSDPVWPGLSEPIAAIDEKRSFGEKGERFLGDISLEFALSWKEGFPPRDTSPLQIGGQPIGIIHETRDVITPFVTIELTNEMNGVPEPQSVDASGPAPGVPQPTQSIDLPQP